VNEHAMDRLRLRRSCDVAAERRTALTYLVRPSIRRTSITIFITLAKEASGRLQRLPLFHLVMVHVL
jgi:hypothetical protein